MVGPGFGLPTPQSLACRPAWIDHQRKRSIYLNGILNNNFFNFQGYRICLQRRNRIFGIQGQIDHKIRLLKNIEGLCSHNSDIFSFYNYLKNNLLPYRSHLKKGKIVGTI